MNRAHLLIRPVRGLAFLSLLFALAGALVAQETSIGGQLVELRLAPVGLEAKNPRFSWQLRDDANGRRQTAWQIQVARSAETFAAGGSVPVWDSGWVESDQSHLIPYAGAPLVSSTAYYWRVRIKDESGRISAWSATARWVTGLLDAENELKADWIGFDQAHAGTPTGDAWFDIGKARWICHPDLPKGRPSVAYYRASIDLPANTTRVMVGLEANFSAQLFVNGIEVLQGGRFGSVPSYLDVTPWIRPGPNRFAVRLEESDRREHSGLIASIRVEQANGETTRFFTDESWQASLRPVNLWAKGNSAVEEWKPVKVLGRPGEPNTSDQGDPELFSPRFDEKVFSPPAVYLRKEIELAKPVRFAVFHGTAQGLYDLHVNGHRVTPTGLQPGHTQFEKHTSYVSTDVTAALRPGRNALGAVLADGWFRGTLLWFGRERFGKVTRFSGQLEVEYADGTRDSFRTDPTWKASFGPILQSDLMNGEIYDARLEPAGWDQSGFADQAWRPVAVTPRPAKAEFAQRAHPTEAVRSEQELPPKTITEPHPGVYVVDFGQNFAGWARLKLSGQPGQTIYLRFAEDVYPDGTIYTANLRGANPADRYICKGGGMETWEPRFTYHGFRYVQITGLTEKPGPETLTGIVAHSGGPITSTFASSSSMLNRLYQNVLWSQRSNYFETMTDCPQRDERYGWVGDAHFFLASSAYNQNGASFFHKWFLDCVDTQNPKTGNISNGAPGNRPGAGTAQLDWSAAMMITPWMIWQRYGDAEPIRQNYAALRLYLTQWEKFATQVNQFEASNRKGAAPYRIIGDWVSIEKGTSKEFIGRVLGYLLSTQMAACAEITGHAEDRRTFTDLAARFRGEIIRRHIAADGTVTGDTQTAYAYVSRYGLYAPAQAALIREKFRQRMIADHHGVRTGFHGTANLLQGLSTIGLSDQAASTMLNEEFPGWGCMVKRGATTIWEHWDGKHADGTFPSAWMNSFNHYTFGGCGEWMMGYLVGLQNDSPGFKCVRVEPSIIPNLDWVAGSFESPYGTVSNRWERKNGRVTMRLVVPPNSTGRVILPATVRNLRLEQTPISAPTTTGIMVTSGTHQFSWDE